MTEVGRDLWRSSGPSILLKQGCLVSRVAWAHVRMAFEYLQVRSFHNLPGIPMSVLRHSHSEKKVLSCWDGASCVSVCAQCLLPCHWAPLRRAWLSCLYIFLTDIYIYWWVPPPQAFSSPGWIVPDVPVFLHRRDAPVPQLSLWPFVVLSPVCPRLSSNGEARNSTFC